jgi:hypothetical protein
MSLNILLDLREGILLTNTCTWVTVFDHDRQASQCFRRQCLR